MGLDDTIERRRGKNCRQGIYRDPVRSSDSHLVSQWSAVVESDASGADSLGTAGLGYRF